MKKTLRMDKVYVSEEERSLFIGQMNMRFNVIKELMDSLSRDIDNDDEEIRAKALFCAFNLVLHLDKFVDEMREVIKEAMIAENSIVN